MKKLLSILLICTMMFCLAACGKDKAEITEDDFVGNWSGSYVSSTSGEVITYYLEVYKGGTGKQYYHSEAKGNYMTYDTKWGLNEDKDVLTIEQVGMFGGVTGFEYDKENKTLTKQDQREVVLTKQ